MDHNETRNTRREWLGQVAAGAAGLSVLNVACNSSQQTPPDKALNSSDKALKAATGPTLNVIFHGMVVFQLPKPSSPGANLPGNAVIQVHLPSIAGHSFQQADSGISDSKTTYKMNPLVQNYEYTLNLNPMPTSKALIKSIKTSDNVFLSGSSANCKCSIPSDYTKRWCLINAPLPDVYQSPVMGYNKGGTSYLFQGNDAKYCTDPFGSSYQHHIDQMTKVALVHVFQYQNVTSATLDWMNAATAGTGNQWKWAGGDLLIYAEPPSQMAPSADHLHQLDSFLGLSATVNTINPDLDFVTYNTLVGDSNTNPEYQPLYQLLQSSAANLGGSPADCLSVWGS